MKPVTMAAAVLSGAAALTFAGAASASASDVSPASASGKCTNGDLCLFADSNFNGTKNQFGMPASGTCADITGFSTANRVSSIDFPAPGAHQAWFYDNGNFVLSLAQNHYLKNLSSDTSASGGNANDKIDEVVVC